MNSDDILYVKKNLAGQRFGMLVAIIPIKIENKRTHWKFICDCGNEYIASGAMVSHMAKKRNTISCGCYKASRLGKESRKYKKEDGTWHILHYEHKISAEERGLKYLSFENYKSWLIEHPYCWYCGDEPPERYYKYGDTIKCHGLDRIDSSKDYDLDNIRTACKRCNKFKLAETEDEFFRKIKSIYLLHQDKMK